MPKLGRTDELCKAFGEWLTQKITNEKRHYSEIDGFVEEHKLSDAEIKMIQESVVTVAVCSRKRKEPKP